MIRGLYTAASGMLAGQRRQEVLTNNLNNAHTVGYKSDEQALRSFPEMLILRMRELQGVEVSNTSVPTSRGAVPIGPLSGGVYTHEIIPQFTAGPITYTNNPFDVAIAQDLKHDDGRVANLFFSVRTANGDTLYTRDGRWMTNAEGQLATYSGDLVLDQNGNPIEVDGRELQIQADGFITLTNPDDPADVDFVQLGLVMVENPSSLLVKAENGYFRTVDGQALAPIDPADPAMEGWHFTVAQGAIEESNVDVTKVMTQMVESFRYYEANQRVLQATDRTLEKAVTEIGRV